MIRLRDGGVRVELPHPADIFPGIVDCEVTIEDPGLLGVEAWYHADRLIQSALGAPVYETRTISQAAQGGARRDPLGIGHKFSMTVNLWRVRVKAVRERVRRAQARFGNGVPVAALDEDRLLTPIRIRDKHKSKRTRPPPKVRLPPELATFPVSRPLVLNYGAAMPRMRHEGLLIVIYVADAERRRARLRIDDIAVRLGLSRRSSERHVKMLIEAQYLRRVERDLELGTALTHLGATHTRYHPRRRHVQRWWPDTLAASWTDVPVAVIRTPHEIGDGLKPQEQALIFVLFAHYFGGHEVRPSMARLAQCMGISPRRVRMIASDLEGRGLLIRGCLAHSTNWWILRPLWNAILGMPEPARPHWRQPPLPVEAR